MMLVYNTVKGPILNKDNKWFRFKDTLFFRLLSTLDTENYFRQAEELKDGLTSKELENILLPPIEKCQEVWAAGVTYKRSRNAREAESGGSTFYDKVYHAERPELFIKAPSRFVVGHGEKVRIRKDSEWDVPEPELAVVVDKDGKTLGLTIGNDMSSRSIEGENPLYLTQAKVYDECVSLGPGILVGSEISPKTVIKMKISRNGNEVFQGTTSLSDMKRDLDELIEYLYREASFPDGVILMTGTGIIPEDNFTLESGDSIEISISGIGTLKNQVTKS